MIVRKKSLFTGKINKMDLPIDIFQFLAWLDGELIQDAMPNLSADQREFLLSGATPEEWAEVYGEDDEE